MNRAQRMAREVLRFVIDNRLIYADVVEHMDTIEYDIGFLGIAEEMVEAKMVELLQEEFSL